jgi:hypothetical protein
VKSVVAWNPQIPSGSWNTAAGYQPTSEWHTITPLHGLLLLSYMWQQNICKTVRTTFYTQTSKITSKSPTCCIITCFQAVRSVQAGGGQADNVVCEHIWSLSYSHKIFVSCRVHKFSETLAATSKSLVPKGDRR